MAEAVTPERRMRARSLLGVIGFLGKYPKQVALSVALLLVVIGIDLVIPLILGTALTNLRWHVEWGAAFSPSMYVQLLASLALVRAGLAYLLGPLRNELIQTTLGDIRAAIYNALQRLAFDYHDRANTGELISRSTTDVSRLQDFLYACLFLSIDIGVSLVVATTVIILASPVLGIAVLATMIPTISLITFYARQLQPRWRKVHDLHGAMTTVIQENIAGVRVVKAFAKEDQEILKFTRKREAFLQTMMQTVEYWATRVPLAQFLFGLSLPLVLWLGGRQVIRGELLIGELAAVVFYLMSIGHRVAAVGQFTNIVQNASASAERILELIREPQTVRSGKQPLPAGPGAVQFEEVSFQYREGRASLSQVSFEAKPGRTYAVVGPTGSGKTTLVNLVPRFYDATGGRVLVEGVDVRQLDLAQLRRAVGVIFQETFLFTASVAENIAYGRPSADLQEIQRAAHAAQAHEFINSLPDGYHTMVGERGITLSGGQKQRIAIARAFLMNPRILILDDATASVDAETERLIQEALTKLCSGRTVFIIAHRYSTVRHADHILVLREGRLVEQGRHADLVQRGGFYCELFEQEIQTTKASSDVSAERALDR